MGGCRCFADHCLLFFFTSRSLHGALKGSIGVVKCMTAELTDETNIARGFSLLPMTWAIGYVIGLAIFAYSRWFVLANVSMS